MSGFSLVGSRVRWLRVVPVAALFTLTAFAGTTAAHATTHAQTAPAPAPVTTDPNAESFALTPTGADTSQPGSRPTLTYTLAPGATVTDSVTVWNYSPRAQLNFRVYPTDAYNNASGDFSLLTGAQKPKDAGSWVTVAQQNITVPPQTSVQLPISITVPRDAKPGDHAGAVLVSSLTPGTDSKGHQVELDRRTGTRLYIRVTGPVNPALVVENLSSVYHPTVNPIDGKLDVSYTIRNAGNVRLGAHQHIALKNVFGMSLKERKPADLPELLPGNHVTFHAEFTNVPAWVRLSTDISVNAFSNQADLKHVKASTSATSHAWAMPWTLLALIAIAIAIWRLYVRRRRQRGGGKPPGGGGPPPGGGRLPPPTTPRRALSPAPGRPQAPAPGSRPGTREPVSWSQGGGSGPSS